MADSQLSWQVAGDVLKLIRQDSTQTVTATINLGETPVTVTTDKVILSTELTAGQLGAAGFVLSVK